MIRTLIFGAIAAYVGKKLYNEGKLTEFKNDLTSRLNLDRDPAAPRAPASTTSRASIN
jgi:hypothetical protein